MRNNALPEAEKYAKLHKRRRVWHKVVGCLACMVVFITTYMLILPAITMEKTAYCGQEEHTHSNACYETRLVCGKEETTETPHTHTDECYEEHKVLVCGKEESAGHVHDENCVQKDTVLVCTDESEEHEHTDECYQTTESYVCGKSEGEGAHTHTDDCYDTERVLICDKEESAVTPHTHTDSCYEKVMVCKKKEHTHQLSCYSNSSADVESASVWERSLSGVKLTGIWADDVISVAESQIGYKESKKNYIVTEDGKTKGYTRYGDWYGNAYGDWCAMFVSFCLNYADIPESAIPYEASCQRWIKATSGSLYYSASDYTPQKGDLIFFDWDNDGHSDHVGLVASVSEDGSSLQAIEGNSSSAVRTERYNTGDRDIMGYAALPENPALEEDDADLEDEAEESLNGVMLLADDEDDTTSSGASENTNNSNEQTLNVTGTSGSATYNKDKDTYTVDMTIDFTIDNSNSDMVSQTIYVYNYPAGYPIPAALTEGLHTLHDKAGNNAGTYTFRQNDDGTFSVVIYISEEYAKAQTTGETITGYVSYKGTMDGYAENEKGELVIGSGDDQIIIPAKDITYPDGETHNYNVRTEKNGEYKIENNQLIYTVNVYSTKGTPDVIIFEDTLTADGLTLGEPTITVQKMSRTNYGNWQTSWTVDESSNISVNPKISDDNKTISMSLPKLSKPTATSDNGKLEKGYLITYIYDLTDVDSISLVASNKVKVSSSCGDKGPVVEDDANKDITIDRTLTFEKSGCYDRSTNTIQWTLKVNTNKTNIAGATITDEMFSKAVDNQISVEPNSGYTYSNNTITFISLDGNTSNNQTYTITYSTVVDSQWDDQTIDNKATLDPTPESPNSGDEIEKEQGININGGGVEKTKVNEIIADDKNSAVVEWKVTINVPDSGLSQGTEIKDIASNEIWMTREQIIEWNCVLYWQDAGGNTASSTSPYNVPEANVLFNASDGNTYTFDVISQNENGYYDTLTYQLQKITLDEDLIPPSGATKLVFTYKTTVDLTSASDGWNKYTNTVKVKDKEASAEFNYEVKTPNLSKTHGNPTYTTENDQVKYVNIPWTVTIEVPDTGWLSGKTLTDDLTRNEWNNKGDSHVIIYQEALNLVRNAKWENGTSINLTAEADYEVKFITATGVTYTYQELLSVSEDLKSSLEFISFTILPLKAVLRPENETKIVLNVVSRADISSVETGDKKYYRNWVYVGSNNASDQYQYTKRENSVTKYDGNWKTGESNTTSSDGKVNWIVEVQLDNQEHRSVSITDTLPQSVTLDSLRVAIDTKGECYPTVGTDGTIRGEANGYVVSGTYDQSNRVIKLEVVKTDNSVLDTNKFQFYIYCLADENLYDNQAHAFKNDVTAKVDETSIGSSSQTQNWTYQEQTLTHDVVTKEGKWDNNARLLEYQVAINPDGKDLVPDSDTLLTLIDELTYNHKNSGYQVANNTGGTDWVSDDYYFQVNLLQNRVKLYFAKLDDSGNLMTDNTGAYLKNGEVLDWSWTYSTSQIDEWRTKNTLTITGIPDSTPLIMEYAYQVSSDLPERAYIQKIPINNTAKLMGNDQIGSDDHSGGEWKEQTTSGGIDSDKKTLKLVKVEQGHYETVLSGAEFKVYAYDNSTSDYGTEAVRVYTTDNAGSFSIQYEEDDFPYSYNTLYKVVETKAPDGYVMPETVTEYYFYFSDTAADNYLPESMPTGAMDLSKASYTVYAENVKNTTEITVVKKWQDSGGNTISHSNSSVTINLYQKTSQGNSSGGGESGGTEVNYKYTSNNSKEVESGTLTGIKVGSTVNVTVTMTYDCTYWQPNITLSGMNSVNEGTWTHGSKSIYTCQATITEQSVEVDVGDSAEKFSVGIEKISDSETDGSKSEESDSSSNSSTAVGILYDTISLDSAKGWTYTFTGLPLTGTDKDGNPVTYYYYIEEVSVPNYTSSYENNGDIQSGTITVTNQATDNPVYELPETGGSGTKLYTIGGMLLMACAGFLLMYNKKRRKEDMASS